MSGEHTSGAPPEGAKQWEGQLLDGLFPLREHLAGDIFVTEYEGQRAAVKVAAADGRAAEQLLSYWRLASKVSHPHLIRLWKIGRSQLDGTPVAYVVMECAEENLGQVLPDRPLTPAEVNEMLGPTLDALVCIHREGFVHGRIRPSNIMAMGDTLKLSSDSLRRIADVDDRPAWRGAEAAPEGKSSPAADIWALGVTLVETLTQRRPSWAGADNELVIPDEVPEPFPDIIRRCLRPHPQQRCTAAEIIELLGPRPAIQKKSRKPLYAAAAAVAVMALAAAWLLRPQAETPHPVAAPPSTQAPPPQAEPEPAQFAPAKAALPPPAAAPQPEPVADPPASEPEPPETAPPANSPEVAHQPMPEVLPKARRSIRGKVNVTVKAHSDAYGTVTEAALEPPHVSRYFSGVSVKAVRRWKFRPVKSGETYVPQDWMVRFEFTRDNTKVQVEHVAP